MAHRPFDYAKAPLRVTLRVIVRTVEDDRPYEKASNHVAIPSVIVYTRNVRDGGSKPRPTVWDGKTNADRLTHSMDEMIGAV